MSIPSKKTGRVSWLAGAAAVIVLLGLPPLASQAQPTAAPAKVHLNPVIAKLAAGQTVFGISANDFSLADGTAAARSPVDFVYADMEHSPLSMPALQIFQAGMADKASIAKKGYPQPNVALFGRFPLEAQESGWVVKQALDIGLMGIFFPGVETPEQALTAVKSMRFGQLKGSKYFEPQGTRGASGVASWAWGVSGAEYEARADLWPLNPDGDLLAVMMIESPEAVENIDKIAATPGVGAIFVGSGNDLSHQMGVKNGSPEVEAAFRRVVAACKKYKIGCMIGVNSSGQDVVRRMNEGWNMIRSTVPAVQSARALLGQRPAAVSGPSE